MEGDLVHVFTTASVMEGYLARGRLEAEGIPVLVKGEGEGPYRMGPLHLWVPSVYEVQARLILESIGTRADEGVSGAETENDEQAPDGSGG